MSTTRGLSGLASRATAAAALTLSLGVMPVEAEAAPAEDGPSGFGWQRFDSGTGAYFSSLDAVSADVAWIGSFEGVVARTVDGGTTFSVVTPPYDPEQGIFVLDVEASSARTALVAAYLYGDDRSLISRTTDGGATWTEVFTADSPFGLSCMAMFDRRRGFAVGDPIDGKFQVVVTRDAGRSWELIPGTGMPDALPGEAGWGFGGECAAATGRKAFFGTSFIETGRIFRSNDFGETWEVSPTDIPCCVRAIDFRTNKLGLAFGAHFENPDVPKKVARSTDGGVTWTSLDEAAAPEDYLVDVAWWSDARGDERVAVPGAKKTAFAGGETSAVSVDRGKTWTRFDDAGELDSVECVEGSLECWAAGPFGTVAKLVYE